MRDIYQIQIFKLTTPIEDSLTLALVKEFTFGATPILFRQSPFNATETMVLTEGSKFFTFSLDDLAEPVLVENLDITRQESVLESYVGSKQSQNTYGDPKPLDEQEKKVAMFKQDIQCFDYGNHPLSILAGNFRNVYLVNRRSETSTAQIVA